MTDPNKFYGTIIQLEHDNSILIQLDVNIPPVINSHINLSLIDGINKYEAIISFISVLEEEENLPAINVKIVGHERVNLELVGLTPGSRVEMQYILHFKHKRSTQKRKKHGKSKRSISKSKKRSKTKKQSKSKKLSKY
jgi:hypothetical protein